MKIHLTYLVAILIGAISFQSTNGVTFLRYTKDSALPSQDDAFTPIPLTFDLPFFGELFRKFHVSTNGIIYFGRGSTAYVPSPFPLNGTKCVAAYWVDSDPREGGDIYYQEVLDSELLRDITNEITSKFVGQANYKSSWAFIVTFSNVSRYGCRNHDIHPCHKVVNHQTVITSNGRQSFVIFLYDKLEYAFGQIGFNAGDGKRFFLIPESNTNKISEYALNESNVGEPGKWIFSVNDEILSACGEDGLLEIYPKKVLFFGGQEIEIAGPCLPQNQFIEVRFGDTIVNCSNERGLKLICICPYVDVQGRVDVSFEFNNKAYKSFIVTHDINDELVQSRKLDVVNENVDSQFQISWNNSFGQENLTTISGMQEDIVVDEFGTIISLGRRQIFIKVQDTGMYDYTPTDLNDGNKNSQSNLIRKIYLHINGFVLQRIVIGSNVPFSCPSWYGAQLIQKEVECLKENASCSNPCQPTVPRNFPFRLFNGFEMDDSCFINGETWCKTYKFGAKACYTSTNNSDSLATQCCYDENAQLILGATRGGSLSTSVHSKSKHFVEDLLPYLFCCKLQNDCEKYYEKRPSIDSTRFAPPQPIPVRGDPHFTTFDGTEYVFNPVGEFVYVQGPDLDIQTRISQYIDINDVAKPASYFSAFALKSSESDVVQVEITNSIFLKVKYGNSSLQQGALTMNDLHIDFVNDSHAIIESNRGIKLEILLLNRMLHAIVIVNDRLKGNVFGLIGNWDDDAKNDFMLPDKTFIPIDSTNEDIHYKFGMAWRTTENTSIFSYPDGLSWKDFQKKDFTPVFAASSDDSRCNGDKACLFDFAVTGDINVGLSDIIVRERVQEIQSFIMETSQTCPININITNGFVKLDYEASDLSLVRYTFGCKPNYKLSGGDTVTCVKGKFSGKLPSLCSSQA